MLPGALRNTWDQRWHVPRGGEFFSSTTSECTIISVSKLPRVHRQTDVVCKHACWHTVTLATLPWRCQCMSVHRRTTKCLHDVNSERKSTLRNSAPNHHSSIKITSSPNLTSVHLWFGSRFWFHSPHNFNTVSWGGRLLFYDASLTGNQRLPTHSPAANFNPIWLTTNIFLSTHTVHPLEESCTNPLPSLVPLFYVAKAPLKKMTKTLIWWKLHFNYRFLLSETLKLLVKRVLSSFRVNPFWMRVEKSVS